MRTTTDPSGAARTSLWSAPRSTGPATRLTDDIGAATFVNSVYDLQIVGNRIY
jgi:hypothetical protein